MRTHGRKHCARIEFTFCTHRGNIAHAWMEIFCTHGWKYSAHIENISLCCCDTEGQLLAVLLHRTNPHTDDLILIMPRNRSKTKNTARRIKNSIFRAVVFFCGDVCPAWQDGCAAILFFDCSLLKKRSPAVPCNRRTVRRAFGFL